MRRSQTPAPKRKPGHETGERKGLMLPPTSQQGVGETGKETSYTSSSVREERKNGSKKRPCVTAGKKKDPARKKRKPCTHDAGKERKKRNPTHQRARGKDNTRKRKTLRRQGKEILGRGQADRTKPLEKKNLAETARKRKEKKNPATSREKKSHATGAGRAPEKGAAATKPRRLAATPKSRVKQGWWVGAQNSDVGRLARSVRSANLRGGRGAGCGKWRRPRASRAVWRVPEA